MADAGLNQPVVIQASRIDATLLPAVFSQSYRLYVIQQGDDFGKVANKANEASQGAYDAQQKNDEQDLKISDHEARIEQNEATLADHEKRITQAESTLVSHEERIAANEAELAEHEQQLTDHGQRITANETELAGHEQRITQSEMDITSLSDRVGVAEQDIGKIQTDQSSLTDRVTQAETDIDNLQADAVSKKATEAQAISSPISVATSYSVNGTKVVGARVTGFTAATGTALKGAFNASTTFTVSATYTQAEVQALSNGLVAARQRIKALEDAMRSHGLIN